MFTIDTFFFIIYPDTKKDKRGNMRARFLLAVLIVLILLFSISCQPEPFSIESIDISKDIGEDFAPVGITDEFPAETSIVYISSQGQ